MTLRRKPRAAQPAPLSITVACVLLGGWAEYPAEGENDRTGLLTLGLDGDRGLADRWREHEGWLRQEAERRGLRPQFVTPADGPMFFAERVSKFSAAERQAADDSWCDDGNDSEK